MDERALEQLMAAGVLEQEEDPEEDDQLPDEEEEEEATLPETPAQERDTAGDFTGGRLRQSLRKVWKKISGKSSRQRGRSK